MFLLATMGNLNVRGRVSFNGIVRIYCIHRVVVELKHGKRRMDGWMDSVLRTSYRERKKII